MNSFEQAKALINRSKEIEEFVVSVNLPEGFKFNGRVPYDVEISEGVMDVTVYALSYDEASEIVNEWLEGCK